MNDTAEILDGIRSWVEIESQTADVDGVNRQMSKTAEDFRGIGAKVERISGQAGYGDHLKISSTWGGDGPGVLVLCHLDTVHPKGTLARDLPFRVDGDRAYGPGIADMKGGAYAAFAALRSIVRDGKQTKLPIRFLYTSDEEVGSPTSRALIEREADDAKYVLVTEPARDGGKIVTARKGVGRYVIRAHGRPSHAGANHPAGRSAIREIARQVIAIEEMTDYERGITTNVGQISGGTADNVVPAIATATIDLRVMTLADGDMMDRRFRSLKPHDPDVRLEVTGEINRPPYEMNDGVARLFDHAASLARDIGFELIGVKTGGGSDGNFTAHKVPTLDGLGVDGHGAHTLQEHIVIPSIGPRMLLQRRLMETLA